MVFKGVEVDKFKPHLKGNEEIIRGLTDSYLKTHKHLSYLAEHTTP